MRIKSVEIKNYKAFLGTYKINVAGKNLFIYGENGSGKSSLYYAIKDFFQSSMESINLDAVENIFVKTADHGKCSIKVKFYSDPTDRRKVKLTISLKYRQGRPSTDYTRIEQNQVDLILTYGGKKIDKPHLFLNEARLSAIAISIYLGMIKRHPQGIPCKILFLDDIFIGLDIANRLPLLEVLKTDFKDYQIFITTYDKPWYEYAKSYLEGAEGWLTKEFYAQETKAGYEIPRIESNTDFLKKANFHFNNADYKAAAVYTRSAFEQAIRNYCKKKRKKIVFKAKLKDYTSEDFWKAVGKDVETATKEDVEKYRDLVLNPFSHYNTEKHEIRTELQGAIRTIKQLKKELRAL